MSRTLEARTEGETPEEHYILASSSSSLSNSLGGQSLINTMPHSPGLQADLLEAFSELRLPPLR